MRRVGTLGGSVPYIGLAVSSLSAEGQSARLTRARANLEEIRSQNEAYARKNFWFSFKGRACARISRKIVVHIDTVLIPKLARHAHNAHERAIDYAHYNRLIAALKYQAAR